MSAKTGDQSDSPRQLGEALKRFCRSIELCDDYLRGYYGLKTVSDLGFIEGVPETESRQKTTQQLLGQAPKTSTKQAGSDGFTLPSTATVQSLDALATEKLAEITRRFSAGEKGWQGYDGAEIAAARELLQTDSSAAAK